MPLLKHHCWSETGLAVVNAAWDDLLAAIRTARADDCCGFWEPVLGCRNEEHTDDPDGNTAVGREAYAITILCDPVRKEQTACVDFQAATTDIPL